MTLERGDHLEKHCDFFLVPALIYTHIYTHSYTTLLSVYYSTCNSL